MRKVFFTLAVMFAFIASSMAQTLTIVGDPTPEIDYLNNYTLSVSGGNIANYDYAQWTLNGATFDYTSTANNPWGTFKLTPEDEGTATLWCTLVDGSQFYPNITAYLELESEVYVYVPSVPDLDGATTVSVMDTESYLCTPSSGTDYEWVIPFGCTIMSGSDYQKSIKFYTGAGQTRLIKVRYKSNGVWSEYGTISVYVDYN